MNYRILYENWNKLLENESPQLEAPIEIYEKICQNNGYLEYNLFKQYFGVKYAGKTFLQGEIFNRVVPLGFFTPEQDLEHKERTIDLPDDFLIRPMMFSQLDDDDERLLGDYEALSYLWWSTPSRTRAINAGGFILEFNENANVVDGFYRFLFNDKCQLVFIAHKENTKLTKYRPKDGKVYPEEELKAKFKARSKKR